MRPIKHAKKFVLAALLGSLLLFVNFSDKRGDCSRGAEDLSVFEGDIFSASGKCVMCHNTDTSAQVMVDAQGNDVSMVNDWIATMMANAARDPLWKAKVQHETLIHPQHKTAIENTCTKCHAPMGHYEAVHAGAESYTMEDLEGSELGQDGVGCVACHKIGENEPGGEFSGVIDYEEQHIIYGPFDDPWGGPMVAQTGFSPAQGDHTQKSEVCASCHTLVTETIDLDGEVTGGHFVEQATYHEWLNSAYNTSETECQNCHMPQVEGGAIAANQPNWLFHQTPFGRHHLVGGNTFMLNLMGENREVLGLPGTAEQFNMVEERTRDYLQNETAELTILSTALLDDTLALELLVTNLAGHKFPSGYPARISWLEIIATTAFGDTILHSGEMGDDDRIVGRDVPYEVHHDVIDDSEDVLIYEMVMQDVEGNVTTILTRAESPVKDNRLLPQGFSMTHESYDTTLVAGAVLGDANFNHHESTGSGTDQVTIKVPFEDYVGELSVEVKLNYQSVPARWLDEMFAESGDQIDNFKLMFDKAEKLVEVVAEIDYSRTVYVPTIEDVAIMAVPNPTADGYVELWYDQSAEVTEFQAFDATGREVRVEVDYRDYPLKVNLPQASGMYYLRVKVNGNEEMVKVLRIRQ
jgi:hypothetical protein